MAENSKAAAGPPLDETWWSQPIAPADLHSNSILFYFADSPFFDKTSNNWIIFQQSLANLSMRHLISTREAFEGRLKTMSGLEFIVAQEPAETGPGMGTGVWVINKQTRRKRQNEEDEIIAHATYFMIGDKVFQAPSLADVMSARMATISSSIAKIFPTLDSVQKWSPAYGRVYQNPKQADTAAKLQGLESKEATPMPDGAAKPDSTAKPSDNDLDWQLVEASLRIQEQYGGEYMDDNPITGRPGEFHLSSTGRKVNLSIQTGAAPMSLKDAPLPKLNTKVGEQNPLARGGKETKSPRTPGMPKPKRRKSKVVATPS